MCIKLLNQYNYSPMSPPSMYFNIFYNILSPFFINSAWRDILSEEIYFVKYSTFKISIFCFSCQWQLQLYIRMHKTDLLSGRSVLRVFLVRKYPSLFWNEKSQSLVFLFKNQRQNQWISSKNNKGYCRNLFFKNTVQFVFNFFESLYFSNIYLIFTNIEQQQKFSFMLVSCFSWTKYVQWGCWHPP